MGQLTSLRAKAIKEPGRHPDGDGLFLVVKASGSKSWMLRIQTNGRRQDIGLGSVKDVSLAEAREKAADTRKLARAGTDPVAAKRAAKRAAAGIPTFLEAAERVHAEQKAAWRNSKHRAQWLATLKTYVFPKLGGLPIDQVDAAAIIEVLQPIWLLKPETARRVKQRIGTVLDWAYSQGHRPSEAPMRAIGKGLKAQPRKDNHFAALPYDQIPQLVRDLRLKDSSSRIALEFLILTAARSGEVRGATWDEIDLDNRLWSIPADRMKAGKAHIVPLSDAATSVLSTAQAGRLGRSGEPVFPGLRGQPLSDMTLTKVLKAVTKQKATVHGFRSGFRDWAAEQTNYAGEVVEAALAHTIASRVEAAYRRTNYLEKRAMLMADWATYLGF